MQSISDQYLVQLGIERYIDRSNPVNVPVQTASALDWEQLRQCVSECQKCDLYKTRTQTVFGVGNTAARLMIIGEAPGANEDRQGKPFVGRAGQLLDAMLKSIGFDRNENVYICNILKCRPPNNRDPSMAEVKECTPYLEQQIALMKPALLLAVGRIAAHYLLGVSTPLTRLRGQTLQYSGLNVPLIVTFHPAYLLRNPRDKGKAYADLLRAWRLLQELT